MKIHGLRAEFQPQNVLKKEQSLQQTHTHSNKTDKPLDQLKTSQNVKIDDRLLDIRV